MKIEHQKLLKELLDTFSVVFILPEDYVKDFSDVSDSDVLSFLTESDEAVEVEDISQLEDGNYVAFLENGDDDNTEENLYSLSDVDITSVIVFTPNLYQADIEKHPYNISHNWYA